MNLALGETIREIHKVILKDLGAYGGFPLYGAAILAAILLKEADFAAALVASLVAVTIVVAAVRLSYFKPRPGMSRRKYSKLYERIDNSSFPSIHAARSVMLSMAISSKLPVLLPLLVLMVLAVCLSRLYFKRHDAIDISAGLIIGYVLGLTFF